MLAFIVRSQVLVPRAGAAPSGELVAGFGRAMTLTAVPAAKPAMQRGAAVDGAGRRRDDAADAAGDRQRVLRAGDEGRPDRLRACDIVTAHVVLAPEHCAGPPGERRTRAPRRRSA